MTKTNAARILDSAGIHYELHGYEVDESDLSAVTVASKIHQDVDCVFKTLVLKGDRSGILVCIIPGSAELDLKKVCRISGNKSAAMIPMKDILEITGYIRGGCSPVGMKKRYPTYIDETCELFGSIFVSAGVRGLQFKINPSDLIRITESEMGDLI
jgi:Cys-tRNA(Pro)/Cys-tRNA(Cys) deacylase